MAVYRNISLSFWTDSKVEDSFTPEDKYMYLYLLTNPHTNICGCYEISIRQISRQTGYNEEQAERIVKRLEQAHDVIRYCKATKEMLIIRWGKYNWTRSEKLTKPIEAAIASIKCDQFKKYLEALYDHINDTVSIPYPYGSDTTVSVSVTDTVSELPNLPTKKGVPGGNKHKYGMYSNVLLTDDDLAKLKAEFPDWADRIDNLSEGIASKGYVYKNHLATIRAWARKDGDNGAKRVTQNNAGAGHAAGTSGADSGRDGDDYSQLKVIRC